MKFKYQDVVLRIGESVTFPGENRYIGYTATCPRCGYINRAAFTGRHTTCFEDLCQHCFETYQGRIDDKPVETEGANKIIFRFRWTMPGEENPAVRLGISLGIQPEDKESTLEVSDIDMSARGWS